MSHQHENCSCLSNPTAGSQTLDEMDFEKSICAAALNRDLVRVKELINKGKINDRDHYGYNALAYAARNGDLQMCQLLIENGIDVNAKTHSNSTPMHRAAMMGHHEVVKLLLQHKACPKVADTSGQTPLHRGANYINVVKILLDFDESLKTIKDQKGNLPVDLLMEPAAEDLKLLLECNDH